jgi:tRNA pseudouridine32 synthase/23S rRNA pseudouridine746 synthase
LVNKSEEKLHFRQTIAEPAAACEFLAAATGLAKGRIKDAMVKGAVWLLRPGQKEKRIRKATQQLLPGDRIELCYDRSVLALTPPLPRLIFEAKHYSVWYKPANLLTQGSRYGDHCSLLRCVEIFFGHKKEIRPVHRLDREASGLVLLAHTSRGASALSELLRQGAIEKRYRAVVHGRPGTVGETIAITQALDGKPASTLVTVTGHSPEAGTSTVDILLQTGRFHQIRRHLSQAGHPLLGDPAYGAKGVRTDIPLQLCAHSLRFACPFTGKMQVFSL